MTQTEIAFENTEEIEDDEDNTSSERLEDIQNPDETKAQRFKRIATRRLNNVLKQMDLLTNCANSTNYEYTEEQKLKIYGYLDKAFEKLKSAYEQETEKSVVVPEL